MFGSTLGGQISWLIPFAAIALIGTLVLIGRRPRTDLARASVLVWGGWLVLEFVVLSFQQGTQHPYYVSAMAPPIAALTGIGAVAFYQAYRRSSRWSLLLPLAIAGTGAWAFVLLRRTPGWNSWLPWTVAAATAVAVLALIAARRRGRGAGCTGRAGGAVQTGPQAPARGGRGGWPDRRPGGARGVRRDAAVTDDRGQQPTRRAGRGAARPRRFRGRPAAGFPGGAASFAGAAGRTRRIRRGGEPADDRLPQGSPRRRDLAGRGARFVGGRVDHPLNRRSTGDGHGRVQGQRSGADAHPDRAVRQARQAALRAGRGQRRVRRGRIRRGRVGGGGGATSVLEWVEQNCTAVPASAYSATANTGAVAGTTTGGLYRCG